MTVNLELSPLQLIALYLWVTGGLGWLWGFQKAHTVGPLGKVIIVVGYPILAALAMLDAAYSFGKETVADIRRALNG